ncbi:MAG TPA: NlpC/P60 family protein [Desulfosporosinus sp.]|nr:NlpC/P60 family protein [Desulfosporosinus sp.]
MGYSRFIKGTVISLLVPILIFSPIHPVYATTPADQSNSIQQESSALIQALSIQESIDVLNNTTAQDTEVIKQHKKAIESLEAEQQTLVDRQKHDTEALGSYLGAQYTEGSPSYFTYASWLAGSTSIGQLISRSSYVDTILSYYSDLNLKIAKDSAIIKEKQELEQAETQKLTDRVQSNEKLLDGLSIALATQTSLITTLTPAELKTIQASRGQLEASDIQRLLAGDQLQAQPEAQAKYLQLLASQQTSDNSQGTLTPIKLNGQVGQLLSFAATFLGVPYTWGGTYPQFDCSSYVQYVYGHFGIKLNRVTGDQYGQGTSVSKDSLMAGDLIFYSTYKAGPSHVGIYVGNGIMINSSNSGVSYASLDSSYWSSRYYGARRVIAQ